MKKGRGEKGRQGEGEEVERGRERRRGVGGRDFRAFKGLMRRVVAETCPQDVVNQANPEGQQPVNVPEAQVQLRFGGQCSHASRRSASIGRMEAFVARQ